jgi:hypothetical protein
VVDEIAMAIASITILCLNSKKSRKKTKMSPTKLYRKPNRLADVFALIQVLAFDEKPKRSVNGLESELQGKPKSAESWKDIVVEHPEFFRLNKKEYEKDKDESNSICLIVRHVKNDILTSEMTTKFFETAIELHDKEHERADRWKVWLPLVVAIISVLSSFVLQYNSSQNQKLLATYQTEFKPKQESYTNFMRAVSQSYDAAILKNKQQLVLSLDQAESTLYGFEPLLDINFRDSVWERYQLFSHFCYNIALTDSLKKDATLSADSFLSFKNYFRKGIYKALFEEESHAK